MKDSLHHVYRQSRAASPVRCGHDDTQCPATGKGLFRIAGLRGLLRPGSWRGLGLGACGAGAFRSFPSRKARVALALGIYLGLGAGAALAERVEHFEAVSSESLEQAVRNFREYNARLETALAGEMNHETAAMIHEMTYTLELALEKMNQELQALAGTLEELHLASEGSDLAQVKARAEQYLSVARAVNP